MNHTSVTVYAEKLAKAYGLTPVLRDVHFQMRPFNCAFIDGKNGSGKTTLLRCLAGLATPTTGTVQWPAFQSTHRDTVARHLGYLPHEPSHYSNLTVRENLLFSARMHDLPDTASRVEEVLEMAGLTRFHGHFPRQLSRGLRQRCAIARVLIHRPRLILLDEPFTALDVRGIEWLSQLIDRLTSTGCSICLTTHRNDFLRELATQQFTLRDGKLHAMSETSNCQEVAA